MVQGINLESLNPLIKDKNKINKDKEQKSIELERGEESFQKVFSKTVNKRDEVTSPTDNKVWNGNQVLPNVNKSKQISEHIQLSDHPGRFAMMKNINPENYEKSFEAFKQITATEFDPDKLPKPEVSALGMRSLVNEIGLGVIG